MTARRSRALFVAILIPTGLLTGCATGRDVGARPVSPRPSAPPRDRRVIIFTLDRVDLSMLRDGTMPTLDRLIRREAAVGLMSRRSSGDRWQRHISMWATLGAGRTAAGGPVSVKWSLEYPWGSPRVELTSMPDIEAANRRYHTLAQPGALVAAVRGAGLTTAVLLPAHADGWPFLVAADDKGAVERVGEFDVENFAAHLDLVGGANLLVIQGGETPLADKESELDEVLRRLRPGRDLLIIVSPTGPSHRHASERTMGPVIVIGAQRGLLTSRSTRREGVVVASDVAPTALAWLGVTPPPEMTGRPMAVLPAADADRRAASLDRRISATFAERFVLIPIAAAIEIAGIVILALWWLLRPESARRWRVLRMGPLLGYALLVGLLVLPWFGIRPVGQVVAIWLGLSVVAAALAQRIGRLIGPASINAVGAALIAADVAAGGDWLRYSVLGSDTIIGGRFYGMGNERAGLFLCSLALAAGFAVQRWGWRASTGAAVGLAFAGAVALVGLPALGVNWGSAIVLTVGLGLTYAHLALPRVRARHVAAIAAAAVLVGAALIVSDRWWDSGGSHIGSATGFLLAGDLAAAWTTYARKMASNWGLLGLSPVVIGFLAMIAAMLYLVIRPPARLAAALSRYRAVTAAVAGCLVAMCVGMVVNDTGSVAAAIISIMTMQTLVYLSLLSGESDARAGG